MPNGSIIDDDNNHNDDDDVDYDDDDDFITVIIIFIVFRIFFHKNIKMPLKRLASNAQSLKPPSTNNNIIKCT